MFWSENICSPVSSRCHLPMLYIGLEYGLTNNSKLAERFFSQALSIAPEDPFVIHEVAVVAFQNGEWVTGKRCPHHKRAFVLGRRLAIVKSHRTKEYVGVAHQQCGEATWMQCLLNLVWKITVCFFVVSAGRMQSAYFLTQWRRSKPSAVR